MSYFTSIDLHGYTQSEAKQRLDSFIASNKNVREITVIHGYQSGSVLQTYIRKQYKHARIERKMLSLNPGTTILVLKPLK